MLSGLSIAKYGRSIFREKTAQYSKPISQCATYSARVQHAECNIFLGVRAHLASLRRGTFHFDIAVGPPAPELPRARTHFEILVRSPEISSTETPRRPVRGRSLHALHGQVGGPEPTFRLSGAPAQVHVASREAPSYSIGKGTLVAVHGTSAVSLLFTLTLMVHPAGLERHEAHLGPTFS